MSASDDPELPSRVCLSLMRLGTRMAVGFDQRFADFGLTQAQFRLLIAVWNLGQREGATPTALAEHLFLERASVSVLLKKLLEQGLLVRLPGENLRSYRVALTDKSGALLHEVAPRAQALADATFESFPIEDLQKLEALLKTLEIRLRSDAQEFSEKKTTG
jgi:DNA-binding MarR family transcriptional regulator